MAADREARRRLAPQTQNPSSLAPRALRRQTPKVGAVCGKAARTDLCGGTGATRFPTAITELPTARPATIAPWPAWVFEGSGDLLRCLRRWWLGSHRVPGAGQFRSAPGPSE